MIRTQGNAQKCTLCGWHLICRLSGPKFVQIDWCASVFLLKTYVWCLVPVWFGFGKIVFPPLYVPLMPDIYVGSSPFRILVFLVVTLSAIFAQPSSSFLTTSAPNIYVASIEYSRIVFTFSMSFPWINRHGTLAPLLALISKNTPYYTYKAWEP